MCVAFVVVDLFSLCRCRVCCSTVKGIFFAGPHCERESSGKDVVPERFLERDLGGSGGGGDFTLEMSLCVEVVFQPKALATIWPYP